MVPKISRRWLLLGGVLLIGLLFLSVTLAIARTGPSLPGGQNVPTSVSFQGTVSATGQPFNGTGHFKFAIVNTTGSQAFWTNDGSNLLTAPFTPTVSVPLSVTNGVFSVLLGDTTQVGLTQALTPDTFSAADRAVRVWLTTACMAFSSWHRTRRWLRCPLPSTRRRWAAWTAAPSRRSHIRTRSNPTRTLADALDASPPAEHDSGCARRRGFHVNPGGAQQCANRQQRSLI